MTSYGIHIVIIPLRTAGEHANENVMHFRRLSPLVIPVSVWCKCRHKALRVGSLLVDDKSSWSWALADLLSWVSHWRAASGN